MSCSITIKNLTVKIGENILHEDINLNLSHKEKIAITGHNGSGKTTLLQTIAGLHFPLLGNFEIFHNSIKSPKDYKLYRHLVGYLSQNSDEQFLYPYVEDDIAFSLLARGENKDEAKIKTEMIMEEFGITHLKNKIVYNLSGGEKKLVALAGVLIMEPKIMLLDEPSNDLDNKILEKLKSILKNMNKSAIIVSHDEKFFKDVVHRVYKLSSDGLREIT